MMMEERVRTALKLLSDNSDTRLLSLNKTIDDGSGKDVGDVLEDKHPNQKPAHPEVFLGDVDDDFHPAIFVNIIGESILFAVVHSQGAAGPSGLNVLNWR